MALSADGGRLVLQLLAASLKLVVGHVLLLGLALTVVATCPLDGLLFEIEAHDPLTLPGHGARVPRRGAPRGLSAGPPPLPSQSARRATDRRSAATKGSRRARRVTRQAKAASVDSPALRAELMHLSP